MTEWISVKERLPDDDEAVLMYDDYQDRRLPLIGWYEKYGSAPGFYDPNLSFRLVVSHWMALPKPPEDIE